MANQLGAPRLALRLHASAWRADPTDASAIYYRAYALLRLRGPLPAWEFLSTSEPRAGTEDLCADADELRADLHGLSAEILARFRDFERAEAELARAEGLAPRSAWLQVQRSSVLELEDAYSEALAATASALELRPWYAPAVLQRAHLLLLLDRDEDAARLLEQALEHTESPAAAIQLVTILHDLGRFEGAWTVLDRLDELAPLAEKRLQQWKAAQRSELGYLRGDADSAIEFARMVETKFHQRVVLSLERSRTVTRKLLPVAFVRQHHMTCVPASLTALGRWFEKPVDHLEVAEEICYGGTSAHSERRWAEQNGFVAREFTLTTNSVRALIDRGLPMVVTTVEPSSGHSQVIVGYDENRDTFLVRDPFQPQRAEWLSQEFLERHRAFGPRGLVLVPREQAAKLDGIELADAELYDLVFRLQEALHVHDWGRARATARELEERAPGHRLLFEAHVALCSYAQDQRGLLAATERLLAQYPDNQRLLFQRLSLLADLERRTERLAALELAVHLPESDPVFRFELARELASDARTQAEAERQTRLALRRAPLSASNLWLLSRFAWDARDTPRALELLRFAVCLEETNEHLAENYFGACHNAGRTEEALALLRARFERHARRSSLPARSLYGALVGLRRTDEAFAVLEQAMEARPEDGSLQLFAAAAHGSQARTARARELLERAGTRTKEAERLRARAILAVGEGDLGQALAHWHAVLVLEPLDVDARRQSLVLRRALEGRERSLVEVRELAAAYPHQAALQRLCIEELGAANAAEAETLCLALLERQPTDAWALRELALRRLDQGKLEAALEATHGANQLEPSHPAGHAILGLVLARAGRKAEAIAAGRAAVALAADYVPGIHVFVQGAWEAGEGPAALAFVFEQLGAQRTRGDGLLAWWDKARTRLAPEEVLTSLRALCAERPELWQAHVALLRQLLVLQRGAEARDVGLAAGVRFPQVPEVWLELASLQRALGDRAGEERALEGALAIQPRGAAALRQLARLHEQRGDFERTREFLERTIAGAPLDVESHCLLACALMKLGRAEDALQRVEHALRIEHDHEGGWHLHRSCARAAGRAERTLELLRGATRERPSDPLAWLLLARLLEDPEFAAERLAAAERAVELGPARFESLDFLAEVLTVQGRHEEALAAIDRAGASGELPIPLRGRRAWVLGEVGRRAEAVTLFSELVGADPDYAWGWRQIASNLDALKRYAEYRSTAENIIRRAPQDPTGFVLLGDAERKSGRTVQAKEAFRTALALDESNTFAGHQLFELELQGGELALARQTLARIEPHLERDQRLVAALELACAGKELERARERMLELCRERAFDPWAIREGARLLRETWTPAELERTLEAALSDGRVEVGEMWMEALTNGYASKDTLRRLLELRPETDAFPGAAIAFLEAAGETKQKSLVRKLLDARAEPLRKNAATWGEVGRFWLASGDDKACIRWFSDWRRPDAQSWALLNLGIALHDSERSKEARAVAEHALELAPDHATPLHHVSLAADTFLDGELEATRRHLDFARSVQRTAYFEFLFVLLDLALSMAASSTPLETFAAVRRGIAAQVASYPLFRSDAFLREVHGVVLHFVARRRGGFWAWTWAVWRSASSSFGR